MIAPSFRFFFRLVLGWSTHFNIEVLELPRLLPVNTGIQ